MAVDIGVAALSEAIRVGDSAAESAEVTRLLAFATEAIERHLGDAYATAPDEVLNEAVVRYVGYLFDQPTASRGRAFSNALVNSGCAAILLPYRQIGGTGLGRGEAAGQSQSGTTPTPTPSGPAVDQVARDAASTAEFLAKNAQVTADAAAEAAVLNEAAIQANQNKLMPPSNAEADAGTATTIRGWTAALIRRVAEAVVSVERQIRVTQYTAQQLVNTAFRNEIADLYSPRLTVYPASVPNVAESYVAVLHDLHNTVLGDAPDPTKPIAHVDIRDPVTGSSVHREEWTFVEGERLIEFAISAQAAKRIMEFSTEGEEFSLEARFTNSDGTRIVDSQPFTIAINDAGQFPASKQALADLAATVKGISSGGAESVEYLTIEPPTVPKTAAGLQTALLLILHGIPSDGRAGATKAVVTIGGNVLPAVAWNASSSADRVLNAKLTADQAAVVLANLDSGADHVAVQVAFKNAENGNVGSHLSFNLGFADPVAAAGGATIRRFTIRFDKTTYAYQTATQLGGQVGQWSMTAPYPSGLTRDIAIAGMKTAALNHFTMGEFGVAFVEFSNQKLFGHNPNADFSDRMDIDFETDNIKLTVPTDTQLTEAERNNWSARMSMVS